jgi:predicted CxxxxCH...CXXCH cytochrome family protein
MGLATQLTCDTCHAGSGPGSTTHYTNADQRLPNPPTGPATVSIDAAYTPLTGGSPAFTVASLTCSSVSCHGGQVTPGWQNGTINASNQCSACHAVAATAGTISQYNDAFGRHSIGTHNALNAANGIACTTCHSMTNGSPGALAHFKYLNTTAVDGTASGSPADQMPSGTIIFDPAIVSASGSYSVTSTTQGNGSCTLTCHTHVHVGAPLDTWQSSGAPHPVPFLGGQSTTTGNGHLNATQATFASDCSSCHAYSGTSPNAGAPLCSVCHALADPTQASTGSGTCLSCHAGSSGMPAGPTGTSFPSIAGAHSKHMGLLTPLTCNTCHTGSGAGTTLHYSNANARVTVPTGPASVSIDATYNAQSGTAGFNASSLTCSASSCHGGQVTPNWRTGTIASTSQCSLCHAINGGTSTAQFNDAVGRHSYGTHASVGQLDCTICHDMTSANANPGAVNHFAELNTSAVSSTNKLPSGTIRFKLTNATYPITGAATYTVNATYPEGDGGCALSCHGQTHTNATNHWGMPQGSGAPHPVPFVTGGTTSSGNTHQAVTLTQFNADCTNCHDQSGTSSTKSGPVCTICHTLGSPMTTGMGAGTCLSCHTGSSFATVGPTGTAWPNLAGAHPKHLALLTFTRTTPALPATLTASAYPDCEACHVGSVPGDSAQTHYSNANKRGTSPITSGPASVTIAGTFNAQSGTAGTVASASAFTCSNVSCHGGQVTPGWQTGTIPLDSPPNNYCRSCHKEAKTKTQYNDASGTHLENGTHSGASCSVCHVMTNGTNGANNHWKYLDNTAVYATPDQLSSDTIKFIGGTITDTTTGYTPSSTPGKGNCTVNCHSGEGKNHNGNSWSS